MSANKGKRGRPVLPSGKTKSESLLLKMTPDEKKGFAEAATVAGIPLSVWIRERLRVIAARELKAANKDVPWQDQ